MEDIKQLAESGDALAQYKMGLQSDSYEEAFEWFMKAAEKGLAEAQYALGDCYALGYGVEEDWETAYEWFLKSALQGYALGQFEVAECLASGTGVEEDEEKALEWYIKSAENGCAMAQVEIGIRHDKKGNFAEAAKWYEKAALQGDPEGQHNLGCMYLNGEGVPLDYDRAFKLFCLAAEQHVGGAICNVGYCYEMGYGVEKDVEKANELYLKVADCDPTAAFNIAESYELGRGVEKNLETALKWYRRAEELGDEEAKQKIIELTNN